MPSPSLVHAARRAPDALDHVIRMVRVMQERATGPEEACTVVHLFQAGFTEVQVHAYRDPARAMMQGLPTGLRHNPPGRLAAKLALRRVPEIRAAIAERQVADRPAWTTPVIRESEPTEAAS
ncbi:hypothetical protein MMSR116_29460 [Methylobacterium mesophilicum SR1.6/6]|uniref:Uncharacterized protein n=1 Tax=Methylobacterium mesophilicum SR1.6/6 TaxID=908290 RepID=A0A6B9FZM5_9HYPH|nr:hypothetical protein [Methylobacterium mesophilicum]QGY05565.1 hypothetical protein MMSR116_29460 [Methylobacterium mesophilicum SR1.6/6]